MLNRIRVVTLLMASLVLLALLQLGSGLFFFHVLSKAQESARVESVTRSQQQTIDEVWSQLLQTRIDLSRSASRTLIDSSDSQAAAQKPLLDSARQSLKAAEEEYAKFSALLSGDATPVSRQIQADYRRYHQALGELIGYLAAGNMRAYLDQPTQKLQDAMEDSYASWRAASNDALQQDSDSDAASYRLVRWQLVVLGIVVAGIIVLLWLALRRALLAPLAVVQGHIKDIAQGDLTRNIAVAGQNEMAALATSLREMQQSLIATVASVRNGSDAIYSGTSEIAAGNNDLSARTEQQAASLEETAASMEQLTATVKQNADNARQAAHLAKNASDTAQRGGEAVQDVVKTMHEISGSSRKIADIIGVIDGIAFQTNILALNAAVEAARAGEQGRGFAVVAGEVRNLASRSAQAAKEIKGLIEDSVSRVNSGSQQVEAAGETMSAIVTAVTQVTDIMGEIASASDEQSRGIDQVAVAVTEMDRVTQQNAALVQESAAAASSLEEQAQRLNEAVSIFRLRSEQQGRAVAKTPREAPVVTATRQPQLARLSEENWETF